MDSTWANVLRYTQLESANQYTITLLWSLLSTAVLPVLQHLKFTFDVHHSRQLVFYLFPEKRPHAGSESWKPTLKAHILD
jgi:hypothetical protein